MKASEAIKPISYLKAHASEIIRDVSSNHKTIIITQNGEAKVVLQDIKEYEKTEESLALLKILAISSKNLEEGNVNSINNSFKNIRKRIENSGLNDKI
jgi:prevent-host-death family protein